MKIGITVHDLLNNTSDKEITEEVNEKIKFNFYVYLTFD